MRLNERTFQDPPSEYRRVNKLEPEEAIRQLKGLSLLVRDMVYAIFKLSSYRTN